MLKKGDRIRFLNTTGGGIVSEILDKGLVKVTDDEGFDIPVLARECVLVEQVNEENNLPTRRPESASSDARSQVVAQETKKEEEIVFEEVPDGDELRVALAFVPEDVKKLQTTTFDWYMVNDSNYHLYYTISSKQDDGAYALLENGLLHRNTTFLLRTIGNEELSGYERLYVQVMAFKDDKNYDVQQPLSVHLHIRPISFLKLHSFGDNDYFDEPAMVFSLNAPEQEYDLSEVDFSKVMTHKERVQPVRKSQPQKRPEVIEVDLHINQLLDTTAGLTPSDMLAYQLKVFEETLAAHKQSKGQKIVFIHGKGNGTLRNEILKLLKHKYASYPYQDASFREYGFGATMITIR
ncbi:MAG: DUF2027 domain-containing protein [Paludibacteraceae bacterium]|nr:DUF2027 domain-containing protein [Paludibacteraceae bacterium]